LSRGPDIHTPPELRSGRLCLRTPRDADAAAHLALGRDADIARMYGLDRAEAAAPLQEAETLALAWLERLRMAPFAWIIEHDGRPIGEIRLHPLEAKDQTARIAIGMFDPRGLGQGLGTEAMRLVLTYGFDTLGLHRIELRVLVFNARAIACYQKCGFVVEGRLRQSALIDGERHDDLIMGLLAPEFHAR
jgi:RimJ/RimL family protein N-acetyltransferase